MKILTRAFALLLCLFSPWPATAQAPQATPPPAQMLSGYMEFHLNQPAGQPGVLDFHRFVLLFTHRFSERIRFVGDLELEHAFVEGLLEAGELKVEQAYLDFLLTRGFNLRAGVVLVPVGIINERHEPPVFNGVERPFVDTVIVPSTWYEGGAGVHGEIGTGWRYRAYVLAPLNALAFNAEEGILGGRQKGSQSDVRNVAFTGRVEYIGVRGLQLGLSGWRGESSFAVPRLDATVGVIETDARYRAGRFEGRAQYAHIMISDAANLNDSISRSTGVSPNVASQLRGFYTEASYRIWDQGAPRDLVAFVRYENFDTQFKMPAGFLPLKEFDREAWVAGFTYYPDPDIAVKIDFVHTNNESGFVRLPRTLNVGLGWWF